MESPDIRSDEAVMGIPYASAGGLLCEEDREVIADKAVSVALWVIVVTLLLAKGTSERVNKAISWLEEYNEPIKYSQELAPILYSRELVLCVFNAELLDDKKEMPVAPVTLPVIDV